MEKSTVRGPRKGLWMADNPMCVGVGILVDGVQCWLVGNVCVDLKASKIN